MNTIHSSQLAELAYIYTNSHFINVGEVHTSLTHLMGQGNGIRTYYIRHEDISNVPIFQPPFHQVILAGIGLLEL